MTAQCRQNPLGHRPYYLVAFAAPPKTSPTELAAYARVARTRWPADMFLCLAEDELREKGYIPLYRVRVTPWITHVGPALDIWEGTSWGEPPTSIDRNAIVKVKFRNGETSMRRADKFRWKWCDNNFDIVAYQIVKEGRQ